MKTVVVSNFLPRLDNMKNAIQCDICPHNCTLKPEQYGVCKTHTNQNGKLVLSTMNQPRAIAIDPIEKKPLYHFHPGEKILSYATAGCNMRCGFCQNHTLVSANTTDIETIIPQQMIEITQSHGIKMIAATYSEPTAYFEYALAIMKLAQKADIKNIWVSNGYFSENTARSLIPYLDAINIDLKSFSEAGYQKLGGTLQPVLHRIKQLHQAGVHVEVATLVIPGFNDDDKTLRHMAQFLYNIDPEIVWHLSRFFPQHRWAHLPITPRKTLIRGGEIGKHIGLKNIYYGNI